MFRKAEVKLADAPCSFGDRRLFALAGSLETGLLVEPLEKNPSVISGGACGSEKTAEAEKRPDTSMPLCEAEPPIHRYLLIFGP